MKNTDKQDEALTYTELFSHPPEIEAFKKKLIPHTAFNECERAILAKVSQPGSANILCVIGPSGVGKTALQNEIFQHLSLAPTLETPAPDRYFPEGRRPYLPCVRVTAPTGHGWESRFRSLLLTILEQVNTVVCEVGTTLKPGKSQENCKQNIRLLPISQLEEFVQIGLRERRVRAILVDEAQHLSAGVGEIELGHLADGLKLLGSLAETVLVLFGTGELHRIPAISAQFGRRARAVHFKRYIYTNEDDRSNFVGVMMGLAAVSPKMLPWELLINNERFLYAGCCGCAGILRDWFVEAMTEAHHQKCDSVTLKILQSTRLPPSRLLISKEEAEQCEAQFMEEYVDARDLEKVMTVAQDGTASEHGSSGKRRGKPGRPNPQDYKCP